MLLEGWEGAAGGAASPGSRTAGDTSGRVTEAMLGTAQARGWHPLPGTGSPLPAARDTPLPFPARRPHELSRTCAVRGAARCPAQMSVGAFRL